eukprot:2043430-Rhodomonas_salina.1
MVCWGSEMCGTDVVRCAGCGTGMSYGVRGLRESGCPGLAWRVVCARQWSTTGMVHCNKQGGGKYESQTVVWVVLRCTSTEPTMLKYPTRPIRWRSCTSLDPLNLFESQVPRTPGPC